MSYDIILLLFPQLLKHRRAAPSSQSVGHRWAGAARGLRFACRPGPWRQVPGGGSPWFWVTVACHVAVVPPDTSSCGRCWPVVPAGCRSAVGRRVGTAGAEPCWTVVPVRVTGQGWVDVMMWPACRRACCPGLAGAACAGLCRASGSLSLGSLSRCPRPGLAVSGVSG